MSKNTSDTDAGANKEARLLLTSPCDVSSSIVQFIYEQQTWRLSFMASHCLSGDEAVCLTQAMEPSGATCVYSVVLCQAVSVN